MKWQLKWNKVVQHLLKVFTITSESAVEDYILLDPIRVATLKSTPLIFFKKDLNFGFCVSGKLLM